MPKQTPSPVLTAAAVLCASVMPAFSGSGIQAAAVVQTGSAPVPVIITTAGSAILSEDPAVPCDPADFSAPEAAARAASLAEIRQQVQSRIRSLYPQLETGFSYDTLLSGFSCKIPENLIGAVRQIPGVESVTRIAGHPAPAMSAAAAAGGFPAYYDATGCTGEGQVIAVIDSEIDVTNPMFSAIDGKANSLTPASVAEIADSIGFNCAADPAAAYISSKIPFAADYAESDPAALADPNNYHGTHVAGIAAGNAVTDLNGDPVAGIAPDAQLLFMAVSDPASGEIMDDAAIAAIEDAVKLHADVINLSFCSPGEAFGSNLYETVFRNAEQAGAVICVAAGNNGKLSDAVGGGSPLNPDSCTLGSIPAGAPILSVASADNPYTEHYRTLQCGDAVIPYTASYTPETGIKARYLADLLPETGYEFVCWPTGLPAQPSEEDAAGKIVVYGCGAVPFDVIMETASACGAAGTLGIYFPNMTPAGMTIAYDIPAGFVSFADGMAILAAAENGVHTLHFTEETIDAALPAGMSAFSSWGVHQTLELRPDITGIGGNVESASYYGGHSRMSGTSMSAPYLAGCTAVLTQYLKQQDIAYTGAERSAYIRRLLMNAAVPFETDGIFASPRQQGAGFVSINNAIADKVLMTGSSGEAKIELHDGIGDDFSFEVTLTNTSAEDVTFASARLILSTDGWQTDPASGNPALSGQLPLAASADTDALLHIPAGSSRTETVSVSLDSAQTAELRSVFANGFFAEGFLMLEGAENCCDISVPLLGFCGDWTAIPIIPQPPVLNVSFGTGSLLGGRKAVSDAVLIGRILARVPAEERGGDPRELMMRYADRNELMQFMQPAEVFISPNGDGLADSVFLIAQIQRMCRVSGLQIFNAAGDLADAGQAADEPVNVPFGQLTFAAQDAGIALPDGRYTARCTAQIDYPASYEKPEIFDLPFTVDQTAPMLHSEIRTENGRRILTLTASDAALDGIVVTGTGSGGIAGVYDPASPASPEGLKALTETCGILAGNAALSAASSDPAGLPLAARALLGLASEAELAEAGFSELIPASPDENGVFTVDYDITDLSAYCFTVFDAALNYAVCESKPAAAETIAAGVWKGSDRLYVFTDDAFTAYAYEDGAASEYRCTLSGGILTAEGADGIRTAEAGTVSSSMIRLLWDDGTSEILRYCGEPTPENLHFYPTAQITELVLLHYAQTYLPQTGLPVSRYEASLSAAENLVKVKLWAEQEGEPQMIGVYTVNNLTGDAADPWNVQFSLPDLTVPMADCFPRGIWLGFTADHTARYFRFDGQGGGSVRALEDGAETAFTYEMTIRGASFTFGAQDPAYVMIEQVSDTELYLSWQDGTAETLILQSADDAGSFPIYTGAQLREMSAADYEQKHGTAPADAALEIDGAGGISVVLRGDDGSILDSYALNPADGTGTDSSGAAVDLPQTGRQSPAQVMHCAAAILLMLAGAYAAGRSGIPQRKKERI